MDEFSQLDPNFAASLRQLQSALKGNLHVNSGYRTPQRQAQLYQAAVAKYGSPEAARKFVAPPGKSFHNKGQAADLSGDITGAHKLAAQYGLNFPMAYENWHIEPQGVRTGGSHVNKATTRASQPVYAGSPPIQGNGASRNPLVDWLMALRQQPNPQQPTPYDATAPNVNAGNFSIAGGLPSGTPSVGSSDVENKQKFEKQALDYAKGSDPMLIEAEKAKATAAMHKAYSDYLNAHAAPQYNMPPEVASPQRSFPDLPEAQQPWLDPSSAVLSSLAGLIAPRFAGQFASQPLEAGIHQADSAYQAEVQRYNQMNQQLQQKYESEQAQANAKRAYGEKAASALYNNQVGADERARDAARYGDQAALDAALSDLYSKAGTARGLSEEANLSASQAGQNIAYRQGISNAEQAQYAATIKGRQDLEKTLIPQIGSQMRETQKETASAGEKKLDRQSQADIAAKRITSQEKIAQDRVTAAGNRQNTAFENRKKLLAEADRLKAARPGPNWTAAQTATLRALQHEADAANGEYKTQAAALARQYATGDHPADQSQEQYIHANLPLTTQKIADANQKIRDYIASVPQGAASKKTLDNATAMRFFEQAGHDPAKARKLAADAGYEVK